MSRGTLGSFDGVVTPNTNMLDVFKQNEIASNPNSILKLGAMRIQKIGIVTDANTTVYINDVKIPIPSGIFELAFGMIEITKLVFDIPVNAQIYYVY